MNIRDALQIFAEHDIDVERLAWLAILKLERELEEAYHLGDRDALWGFQWFREGIAEQRNDCIKLITQYNLILTALGKPAYKIRDQEDYP